MGERALRWPGEDDAQYGQEWRHGYIILGIPQRKKQRNMVERKMDVGRLRSEISEAFVSGNSAAAERCQLDFCGPGKRGGPMWKLEMDKGKASLQDEEKRQKQSEAQKRRFYDEEHHFLSNRSQSGQGRGEWEHGVCSKNASLIQTWGSSADPPSPGLASWGQWPSDTNRAK